MREILTTGLLSDPYSRVSGSDTCGRLESNPRRGVARRVGDMSQVDGSDEKIEAKNTGKGKSIPTVDRNHETSPDKHNSHPARPAR